MPRLLLGLVGAAVFGCEGPGPTPGTGALELEATSCKACHQEIVETYARTAHFSTSAQASAQSVIGDFSEGHNVLRTRSAGISFRMEKREDGFYQTGFHSTQVSSRTERIDLVVGSGRRGQTYLFWEDGRLFELPVSYLTGVERWINSPGYADGQIDFGRVIVPRCLECHSTSFTLETDRGAARYSSEYVLGISCEKCHGEGQQHVKYHSSHPTETRAQYILNPARFSRDRKLDNCALCHSGRLELRRPSFSYRPGKALNEYFTPATDRDALIPDVHGNQVGLLRLSKCFRSSPDMSCSTCHDVHQPERDLARLAQRCLGCHPSSQHRTTGEIGSRMMSYCIDCHMPNQRSNAIQINTPGGEFAPSFRSHAIGIYPDVAAKVLQARKSQ